VGEIGPKRRQAILKFVDSYTKRYGYAPTLDEIGIKLDIGKSTVWHHLRILKEEGRITHEVGRSRTIKVK
jgi:SOS-response transcriptional repressor LexA